MSNPFDQFASDFGAAVPNVPAPAPAEYASFQAPAPTPASVMNPPPGQINVSMDFGGYGAPPAAAPAMGQSPYDYDYSAPPGGYGMPQQAAPPAFQGDYGMPEQPGPPMMPPQPATDAYGGGAGFAMAPAPGSVFAPASSVPAHPPASNPFGGYDASQQAPVNQPPASFPVTSPFGMPEAAPEAAPDYQPAANPFDAPPSLALQDDNPFAAQMPGGPPMQPPPMPPQGAPPMPPQGGPPPNPYGVHPGQAVPPQPSNPYGVDPGQGQYQDPWGAPAGAIVPATQSIDPMAGALVPAQPSQQYGNVDPFAVFAAAPAPKPDAMVPFAPPVQELQLVPAPASPLQSGDDLWADMGFDAPVPDATKQPELNPPGGEAKESSTPSGELPPGGEWYDARIFTPTLGVMFFKPQELTDSLFLQTDKSMVDALEERPVVAFIVEGSSARSAGVELGHVLLKVNGIDVKNPKDASRLIKEGPRPLPLLFYIPDTNIVVAEGEHMVKYDTKETTAPNSAKDWKPKYVVIGGIIAQPWMMNMYRSKSEYDIAVIETQARRPVSVKVKQFSLQGARIQNDWQGPQMVKYKNKLHPWKYIVILPVARNPIKISSPNLGQLKPVHEGIRRVLLSQQRDRGQHVHTAAPVRGDPYARPQNGHGGDPHHSHGGGGDPYARGGSGGDPYAHGGGDPYAQGGGGGDPYGGGGDPYARGGAPAGGDPYARGGDPYARGSVTASGGDPYSRY